MIDGLLNSLSAISLADNSRLSLETRILSVDENLGDIYSGAQTHNFKAKSFTTPQTCKLCSKSIWGLSNKGFKCKDCGYVCHAKCQLNVPSNCPGTKTDNNGTKGKIKKDDESSDLYPDAGLSRSSTSSSHAQSGGSGRMRDPNTSIIKQDMIILIYNFRCFQFTS